MTGLLTALVALNALAWVVTGITQYLLLKHVLRGSGSELVAPSLAKRVRNKVSPPKPAEDAHVPENSEFVDLMDVPFEEGYKAMEEFKQEQAK